jgi:FkbM family methyltransferase
MGIKNRIDTHFPALFGCYELEYCLKRISPRGVIHLGGHLGQEAELYAKYVGSNVIWVEAIPQLIPKLKDATDIYGQTTICALVARNSGEEVDFFLSSNNFASSSKLPIGKDMHKYFPHVKLDKSIRLQTTSFEDLVKSYSIDLSRFDFLVLDVQGAELEVLKGAQESLSQFKAVLTEYSKADLYRNQPQYGELLKFLCLHSLKPSVHLTLSVHGNMLFSRISR